MADTSDIELLRNYAQNGDDDAFAELVRRHIPLVYSAALRHVNIPVQAEEITQAVFVILAQKAGRLRAGVILEAWLYETTRLAALSFRRGERRRQSREQEAYMESHLQSHLQESNDPPAWNRLAPLLDDAMAHLGEHDRQAILLRFFKGKNLDEVAAAMGTTEAAAQSRVHRAVEKLRRFFARRGVDSTASALTGQISTYSIQAAPAALTKTVTAVAVSKGAMASASTLTLIKGAATMKGILTFGSISGLFALLGSAYVSFTAQAADSKSSREQKFMLRMYWKRTILALFWLAAYFIALKIDFFSTPIRFDFFAAALVFYFFCIDWLILAREQNLHRRRIQIEEQTYSEAEWTMPRKVTHPAAGLMNVKNMLTAFRFAIFGTILVWAIWFQLGGGHALYEGWQVRWKNPAAGVCLMISISVTVALLAASPYTQLLGWQRRPRFAPIRGDGPPPRKFVLFPIMFPIVIGLMTLAVFDLHEYLVNDGLHDHKMASPNEVLLFNAVLVLFYTAFTIRTFGILERRRKRGPDKPVTGKDCSL